MICLPNSRIRVLAPVEQLHYFDSQSVTMDRRNTALETWNRVMAHPQPVLKLAFRIRDTISSWFGVKKIGGFDNGPVQQVSQGDMLDFFLVEYVDDDTLVLTERDRHLDVMTCVSVDDRTVAITSSVLVHNGFGRAYMLPVGIAHKWIVRRMLKRLQ